MTNVAVPSIKKFNQLKIPVRILKLKYIIKTENVLLCGIICRLIYMIPFLTAQENN